MGQIYQAIEFKETIDLFKLKNFVETGTGIGDSLSFVLKNKPENMNVYTIELMKELYDSLVENFESYDKLELINDYSSNGLKLVLSKISDDPTLFWHDAHFPGADFAINGMKYGSESDASIRTPLETELRIIVDSNRNISNDVFILDDLRIYKDGPFEGGNWDLRTLYGVNGIDFVYDLFDETHHIFEAYGQQGFILVFPKMKDAQQVYQLILSPNILVNEK
jgi:hypothetical protein